MSGRRRSRTNTRSHGLARRWPWLLVISILLLASAVVVWSTLGSGGEAAAGPGGLPGPLGGSSVAQDVNTLVGKPAPAFTLSDSEGQSYSVTPGQGKPLVLVFHMGIT